MEVRNARVLGEKECPSAGTRAPFSGFCLDESLAEIGQKVGVSSEVNSEMRVLLRANQLPSGQV